MSTNRPLTTAERADAVDKLRTAASIITTLATCAPGAWTAEEVEKVHGCPYATRATERARETVVDALTEMRKAELAYAAALRRAAADIQSGDQMVFL